MTSNLATDFTVYPSTGLLVWTVLVLLAVCAAPVAALKGRWILLVVGFATSGLTWLIGAAMPAKRGSWWDRRSARKAERQRGPDRSESLDPG